MAAIEKKKFSFRGFDFIKPFGQMMLVSRELQCYVGWVKRQIQIGVVV